MERPEYSLFTENPQADLMTFQAIRFTLDQLLENLHRQIDDVFCRYGQRAHAVLLGTDEARQLFCMHHLAPNYFTFQVPFDPDAMGKPIYHRVMGLNPSLAVDGRAVGGPAANGICIGAQHCEPVVLDDRATSTRWHGSPKGQRRPWAARGANQDDAGQLQKGVRFLGREASRQAVPARAYMVESTLAWDERVSTYIMYALLVFYLAILVAALVERNWWRALYFIGAIVISVAVLGMTER